VPDDAGTFSPLRLVYVCIAGVTGIFGLVLGVMVLLAYLVKSNSYGAPYLAPYAPIVREDLKDGVFFAGLDKMKYRPKSFPHHNRVRIGEENDE
jgi:spore germination protein KA